MNPATTPISVGVLGCGAWATVVATLFAHNQHRVRLWSRDAQRCLHINTQHRNPDYMSDCPLSPLITAAPSLDTITQDTDLLVYALPAKHYALARDATPGSAPWLILSKGLTDEPDRLLSAYLTRVGAPDVAVLSGPNLAHEIVNQQPAASVIASPNAELASTLQNQLNTPWFRPYTATDCVGVELGGIFKNVLAIASGLCDALDLGQNAKAALLTRGLNEMRVLVTHMGGEAKTVYGLSGIGDLIATSQSQNSRNWQYGYAIGTQTSTAHLHTVEGVRTAQCLQTYAQQEHLNLPLLHEIHAVLLESKKPQDALRCLFERPLIHE